MHTMRRKDRQLSEKETLDVLHAATFGILSTVGPDGEPYGVPLSFATEPDSGPAGLSLVFHAAVAGRKLVHLDAHPEAHFTAVSETRILPEDFSVEYRSVMLYGRMERIEAKHEKIAALTHIAAKYSPEYGEEAKVYIERAVDKTVLLRMRITELSGKQLKKKQEDAALPKS